MLKEIPLTLLLIAASILQIAYSERDYEVIERNNDCRTDKKGSEQVAIVCQASKSHKHKTANLEPVVTQRSAEVPANPSGTTSAEAECNPDEVVTGGGYELLEQKRIIGGGGGGLPPAVVFINTSFKEFAEDNSWHVEIVNPDLRGTVIVHAECLKLAPAK
jgi:hypothetical protein